MKTLIKKIDRLMNKIADKFVEKVPMEIGVPFSFMLLFVGAGGLIFGFYDLYDYLTTGESVISRWVESKGW